MEYIKAGAIPIFFPPGEEATAGQIAGACEKAIRLAGELWGLKEPANCRIYVMTSWQDFILRSAPWAWRIILALTFPAWLFRMRRMWPYAGAWTQSFGRRSAIGVKPPRLLLAGDRSIGARIFIEEQDMNVKMRHLACHELVHACAAGLRLPMWLNEGIAMATVDRFLDKSTVRRESLDLLRTFTPKASPPSYQKLSRMKGEAIAYHTARGYWLVRYLEEKRPGYLKRAFAEYKNARAFEHGMIAELGMAQDNFWREVDGTIADHFDKEQSR
jgi:hypothetical protein